MGNEISGEVAERVVESVLDGDSEINVSINVTDALDGEQGLGVQELGRSFAPTELDEGTLLTDTTLLGNDNTTGLSAEDGYVVSGDEAAVAGLQGTGMEALGDYFGNMNLSDGTAQVDTANVGTEFATSPIVQSYEVDTATEAVQGGFAIENEYSAVGALDLTGTPEEITQGVQDLLFGEGYDLDAEIGVPEEGVFDEDVSTMRSDLNLLGDSSGFDLYDGVEGMEGYDWWVASSPHLPEMTWFP